jgi:cob(I)alamin adenosyltransferase
VLEVRFDPTEAEMSIATRSGDDGNTGLFGGRRVPKDHMRIEAYGAVDELNSQLGLIRSLGVDPDLDEELDRVQSDLFDLGAELATPRTQNPKGDKVAPFPLAALERLERSLEKLESRLDPLTAFILPGGHVLASHFHIARTVCRRAERRTVSVARDERLSGVTVQYLNRLSDWLFLAARSVNARLGINEPQWKRQD